MNLEDRKQRLILHLSNIKRDGIEKLIEWLINKSDYLTAPASTKFHSSYEGGLADHSYNVALKLENLNEKNNLGMSQDTIYIIGLLHDICKCNSYKVEYRNAKNEQGVWEKVPFYQYEDNFPVGVHGDKSVMIIQSFIKLTREETYCIRYHMGAFEGEKVIPQLSSAIKKCPNILWTHMADNLATLDEK